jgi:hypothetical protein
VFVVGDVHGCLDRLHDLLRGAGLADRSGRWRGADARLWLLGDLVDRGPDGIGAIDLVRGLQRDGDVHCLLGNHEALLLGALRFGDRPAGASGMTFGSLWRTNGGRASDLARLAPEHVAWIQSLPPLALEGDTLLLHADSELYLRYGTSVDEIVAAARAALSSRDPALLAGLLDAVSDRFAFADPATAGRMLAALGGRRIVHGHTPLALVLDRPGPEVTEPLVYHGGRCVNVDHGLFLGGRGFVTELARLPEPEGRTTAAPTTR